MNNVTENSIKKIVKDLEHLSELKGKSDKEINQLREENKIEEDMKFWNHKSEEIIEEQKNKVFEPLPVNNKNKILNQLREVTESSEEKLSQVFDGIDLMLNKTNKKRKMLEKRIKFDNKIEKLLNMFPNSLLVSEKIEIQEIIKDTAKQMNYLDETEKILFNSLEILQFNDINRQKIERVIFTIKNIHKYLDNMFIDDNEKEIPIAQHIYGDDDDEILNEEEIEKLISQTN